MIRRGITVLVVAVCTTVGSLYWLHDGELEEAVVPVLEEWNADELAREAGFLDPSTTSDND